MAVKFLNFLEIKEALGGKKIGFMDFFVEKSGVVYIIAVTREKCSGCERQRGLFEKLSDRMKVKYGSRVEFAKVHAHFNPESKEETMQCLDTFQTVAFPTYVICVRNHQGKNRETYRAIEPPMSEIERNIKTASNLPLGLSQRENKQTLSTQEEYHMWHSQPEFLHQFLS